MKSKNIKQLKARQRKIRQEAKRVARREGREANNGLPERVIDERDVYKRLLIVCEGARTEPLYFNQFPIRAGDVVTVEGEGMNTLSLVQRTIQLRNEDGDYDEVWVVFDRDSFPSEQFEQALALAKDEDIESAWSNEAFELWYLLHFEFCDAALSRTTYSERLTRYLGRPYRKNDSEIYSDLLRHQNIAIRNAQNLREKSDNPPLTCNPGTQVDLLVQRLNELSCR